MIPNFEKLNETVKRQTRRQLNSAGLPTSLYRLRGRSPNLYKIFYGFCPIEIREAYHLHVIDERVAMNPSFFPIADQMGNFDLGRVVKCLNCFHKQMNRIVHQRCFSLR